MVLRNVRRGVLPFPSPADWKAVLWARCSTEGSAVGPLLIGRPCCRCQGDFHIISSFDDDTICFVASTLKFSKKFLCDYWLAE